MEKMGLNQIREEYLKFFEGKAHLRLPSFSLVPQNDKSLLIINAGMAPLKPYFTGQKVPPSKRVTTCQKCVRTGDIENVGKTARHGTFFEMLGNFSFGDYFKNEIIPWAWEFITQVVKIPEDRLWVTVYEEDDEAKQIWIDKVGVSPDRVVKMGKEDNFWEHGSGPCGPCSEIHYDRGPEFGCGKPDCKIGCDCDRYVEFWNLVFTQFDRQDDGTYERLAAPNIDTGMGLERMAAIMQGVNSIFEVDTLRNILDTVIAKAGVEYGKGKKSDISVRIITDHVRSITHMVADGILPSNEGRGYVLRRLLRRAARHCKLLGINELYLSKLIDVAIENSKNAYPEVLEKRDYIKKIVSKEEERFNQTLDQGLNILNGYIDELKANNEKTLSGEKAFKLYDTFGFPLDLTKEILEEKDLDLDEKAFEAEMKKQRETARAARKETNYMGAEQDVFTTLDAAIKTDFLGYDNDTIEAKVLVIVKEDQVVEEAEEGDEVSIILDKTPFYVEMGGQISDTGIIESDEVRVEIIDCKRTANGKEIHIGKVVSGSLKVNETVTAKVNMDRRFDIERNHTATHMLQAALRKILGNHVEQAGSLVTDERLRFDFTHFEAIDKNTLKQIEEIVNQKIYENLKVNVVETTIDKAKEMGAMALFGEKYGSNVRVVKIEDYSIELCGGTHISNTSIVGMFKIVSEGSAASGVRRIEAITGRKCFEYMRHNDEILNNVALKVKTTPNELANKVDHILNETREMARELESLKAKLANSSIDEILNKAVDVNGIKVVTAKFEGMDADSLRNFGDTLKDKLGSGLVVLANKSADKVNLIAMATKDAVNKGAHCGNVIKEISKIVGGGGGGRPDMAQAGGKDASKIQEALNKALEVAKTMIK